MMQIQPRVKGRKQKTLRVNLRLDRAKIAEQNVKNRWIEQGIWNDEWTTDKVGERWKHEEVPTPSPEPTPQPELPTQMTRERYVSNKPEKNERTSGITAEKMAAHQLKTIASRPYHQFVYQVSKELEWLEDEMHDGVVNLDQKAYENVRNRWKRRNIWNSKWGDMPGQKWMHEEPDEEHSFPYFKFFSLPRAATQSQTNENGERSGASPVRPVSFDAGSDGDSAMQVIDRWLAAAGPRTETEENIEAGVDRPATTDDQDDNRTIEEPSRAVRGSIRFQAKESAPSGALPPSPSIRKSKRGGQDEAGDEQESGSYELRTQAMPLQRKRSGAGHAARQPPPPRAIFSNSTKPTTSRKAGSMRGSMRNRAEVMVDTKEVLQAAGPTQAHGGRSDTKDHLGRRRSARIQERRGTDKATVYDEIVGASESKFGMGAQQKRKGSRKRPNTGAVTSTGGRASRAKGTAKLSKRKQPARS